MKIDEIALFAFATKSEALEVANHVMDRDVQVATVYIQKGLNLAPMPMCYLVVDKP